MKKIIACLIFLILILCFCPNIAICNSPPLIMKGDTAFPISSDNIRLESEVIKIHYGITDRYGALGHEIEVIFNFHNTGFETDLDIGFPNVASYAEKLRDFEAYDYPSMIPYETQIKEGGTLPEHDLYYYNSMYTWKMHFEEDERKSVYVKYKFESQQWGADYILVTGALWKDRIDKIDVYVDFPKPAAFSQITASPLNYYYNGEGIEWHFENIEPDFNLFVGLVDMPCFYEKKEEYFRPRWNDPTDTYRWDDYFYFIDLFVSHGDMWRIPLVSCEDIDYIRKTVERLKDTNQFVINEIYARHGYDFKLKEWEKIFEDTFWYKCDPEFTPDVFNSMEHAIIAYIKNFDKTVVTDGSDDELIDSINEFQEKYNGKDIFYRRSTYPYYQYTYKLVSSEKKRIEYIEEINEPLFMHAAERPKDLTGQPLSEVTGEYADFKKPLRALDITETKRVELHENGVFIRDGEDLECIFRYKTSIKAEDIEKQIYQEPFGSFHRISDDISASPMGKYILVGTNYELDEITELVENTVYAVSVDNGIAFKLGYGDLDDFLTWWSPAENVVCWQNVKKEPDKLRIYDISERKLSEIDLPYGGNIVSREDYIPERGFFNLLRGEISDVLVRDDGKVIVQLKDNIFYINSVTNEIKSVNGIFTSVFESGIYFYKGSDIYKARFDKFEPKRINNLEHSIWKSKEVADNLHFYYGGAYNLSVFNTLDEKIYWFKVNDYEGVIKPSPDGSRLYIFRDYANPFGEQRVRGAFILDAGRKGEIVVEAADDTAKWLNNNHLLINVYEETNRADRKHILSYFYDVETGERHMVKIVIDSFTSRVVNEFNRGFGTMNYEYNKPYSNLKKELKANAYTISDETHIYSDNRLLYTRDDVLSKGSLIGILKEGTEASKVCYFTKDNTLYSGWIMNGDFTSDIKLAEPVQGFIYDAKIYEFEKDEPKVVFNNCSSQVKILDKKPGWVYINAVDRIFGWVREEEVKFGFFVE